MRLELMYYRYTMGVVMSHQKEDTNRAATVHLDPPYSNRSIIFFLGRLIPPNRR